MEDVEQVRTAEIIATCCLATDLGMGFPFEHGFHGTLMAMELADLLDVDSETKAHTYYCGLLMYTGCTTDSDIATRIFGGKRTESITPVQFGSRMEMLGGVVRGLPPPDIPPIRRLYEVARRLPKAARFEGGHFAALCDVAEMMATRFGLPASIHSLFVKLTERWDGKSVLGRAERDEVPLAMRICHVARDAAYQQLVAGDDHAVAVIQDRAGEAFDPDVAHTFATHAPRIFGVVDTTESCWEAVMGAEPKPHFTMRGEEIDRALYAMGDFADLVSPFLSGHSTGVAKLAAVSAELGGFDPSEVKTVRRAGHLHDLGRVAAHPSIWQKPGKLAASEWEQVRLHTYYTERILSRSPVLSSLTGIAAGHHERLDGEGYHRKAPAAAQSPTARLLAATDFFHAMIEPRPYRAAMTPEQAADVVTREAIGRRLDPEMVKVVVEAAGQPSPEVERPAGMTQREVEIVGLIARGLLTKQVARALDISPKTADRHIQNAYRKMGVSSRAAATLFAMEHGLVSWAGGVSAEGRTSAT